MNLTLKWIAAAVLAFLLSWAATGQVFLGRPLKPLNASCTPFTTANTAVFDGSSGDGSYHSGSLNSVVDSKTFSFSCWVIFDDDNVDRHIFDITPLGPVNLRFSVVRGSSNALLVQGRNSANTTVLNYTSDTAKLLSGAWHHIFVTANLADVAARHVYIDGSEVTVGTWSDYTDALIDFDITGTASPINWIGINADGMSDALDGALSEMWFDDSYLNDISKFFCAGHPVSLGANGELPTGSAPVFYLSLSGSGNSWLTDSSGNSNNFTVNGGSLGSTTSP